MNAAELVRFLSFMSLACAILALLDCPEAQQLWGLATVFGAAADWVDCFPKGTPASEPPL